ncbi:hypothetical protein NP493_990g00037 [Ridgeia piscesae]|uniref:Iron hydrogenase small subunit domain-containing protein n=1 Tax=Ridgeia piscesae TaxID=27915 RepID=A0AAD9KKC1_RIDPI|nr:hypothetical protein NP493_990g00037 [Ridgeia piscesae]
MSLIESAHEFVRRYRNRDIDKTALPMLASACPGWVCYAEKTHGSYILPHISSTKSPQQVMGSLVKHHLASVLGRSPSQVYHVTVMPCYDKKLEASRHDFYSDLYMTRDVDCVITSREVADMLAQEDKSLAEITEQPLDSFAKVLNIDDNGTEAGELDGHQGGGSGGYLEYILRHSASALLGVTLDDLKYKTLRNEDLKEVTVEVNGKVELKFAIAYGFRNIQNIVQKMKRGKLLYQFVELMACPAGCLNGGGQLRTSGEETAKQRLAAVEEIYTSVRINTPYDNTLIERLYTDWLGGHDTDKVKAMLHTEYHAVEKFINALTIKW